MQMTYPQTALEALRHLQSLPDCDFTEFSVARDCHGAPPYLYGKTREGQWIIVFHPEELNYA